MKKETQKNNIKTDNSKETLQAILESVRDGLVILDKTGKIIEVSDSLVTMGGYPKKELIGKRLKFMTMFVPKSLAQIIINFVRTLADNEIMPYEVEATIKSGKKMFGEISGNPLKSKGKIVGVVALIRDITERKKTEEELKEKNEELEKFNKFAVGRELRIIELKNKVKELESWRKQNKAMTMEEFEKLVDEGIKAIPEHFLKKLENVDIIVEETPTIEQLEKLRIRKGVFLFGLYEGIPQTKRWGYGQALPDKITIFKNPIEKVGDSDEEIKKIVTDTVWHELAHHFGMDEGSVRKAEKRKRI